MSEGLVADLGRAADCVSLLTALGARVKSTFVSDHGVTINLNEPGTLADYLDAKQVPVSRATGANIALVQGCLVSWPRRKA